ncbi:hypothetical protein Pla175_28330 [Pirellulimonas nuda]|uniref:Uncharacterized protein n=1 Tax=Pirellulimonas nuda TaxID=2528009 RepID=A0A518DDB3_9BACT|nr:hypothetical protein Pla175_28330 [Pirellulimonas nuda]
MPLDRLDAPEVPTPLHIERTVRSLRCITSRSDAILEPAAVQLSSVGVPNGQRTAIASAGMAKFDAELRAVSAGSGHRCELAPASTHVGWSISGNLAGAGSEGRDVHRCRFPGHPKPLRAMKPTHYREVQMQLRLSDSLALRHSCSKRAITDSRGGINGGFVRVVLVIWVRPSGEQAPQGCHPRPREACDAFHAVRQEPDSMASSRDPKNSAGVQISRRPKPSALSNASMRGSSWALANWRQCKVNR